MKRNLYTLLLAVTALVSGCDSDEFLGVKPRGKDVPSTFQHYEGLLNNFNPLILYSSGAGNLYCTLLSDEWYATKASFAQLGSQMGGPQGASAYRYEADIMRPDENCDDWAFNSSIYTYNMIINEVMDAEGGTEQQKLAVQAEARVMRAWLHFKVAQIFCKPYNEATAATDLGLPVLSSTDITADNYSRGNLKELYDFIVSELEAACPNVQNGTNLIYRTEKGDAYLMLGSVYFYMNQYDKALQALRLAKQYATENESLVLRNYNDPAEYMNFMMGILGSSMMHYENPEYLRDLNTMNTFIPMMCIPMMSYFMPASLYIKQKYMDLFAAGDYRKMFRFGQGAMDTDLRPSVIFDAQMGATSPDLYTLLAECEARSGSDAEAKNILLELRKHRMPEAVAAVPETVATKDQLIRFCVEERIREILGTGKFFFEMRRLWNDPLFADYKADYKHEIVDAAGNETYPLTEDRLVMRIPPEVLNWNDWENNK